MRRFVINDTSLPAENERESVIWLAEVTKAMGGLVNHGVSDTVLMSNLDWAELECAPGFTFLDAFMSLMRDGFREECRFLKIALRSPIDKGLPNEDLERMLETTACACGPRKLDQGEGDSLLLCALKDWIAISYPSEDVWEHEILPVRILQLDTGIQTTSEVDNLCREEHGMSILSREPKRVQNLIMTSRDLWHLKYRAFPHLKFGQGVEENLSSIGDETLDPVVTKLAALDDYARRWPIHKGGTPDWRTPWIRPESKSTMNNPVLRRHRLFKTSDGSTELFPLHTDGGNYRRIHLRIDRSSFLVEIGYIGDHLPL